MKTNWLIATLVLLSPCILLLSNSPKSSSKKYAKLIWSDEFSKPGLPDKTKWNYDVGGDGWGNNELQYYTSERSKNARVEDGMLIIEAHRENWQNRNYTSARLITKGKGDWKYGKIEVRAKLPDGLGTWPAIWMLASKTPMQWPDDGEIDIMEHVGYDQGKIHGSIHCKKYYHSIGTQKTANIIVPDCSQEFHVYEVEWNEKEVNIGMDGKNFFNFKNEKTGYEAWPFDNKMHLLLNVAVGGNWGGAKGVDSTIWPRRMIVDYVRVYQ
ncbi:glycoside hydrolase family 16 protein [Pollutibacter soli]|uniref:glycoside hydrolase family 16 protein n=1 Tax=Pollutibacter soli TaxID=3034157 RepID=UPI003013E1BA